MTRGGKWNKRILYLAVPLALIVAVLVFVFRPRAEEDIQTDILEGCPGFEEAMQAGGYDDGIVFHGLYLIDIHAISDDLFTKAAETATVSNQTQIYYCSEISSGNWYEIADYASIDDISPLGESISMEDVADSCPYVKYYVDSNGLVHDLTQEGDPTVSLYDEPDPYNKYLLSEFDDLRTYMQGDEVSGDVSALLKEFYDAWPKDDYTDYRDTFIDNAQTVKEALLATGDTTDEELNTMMEAAEEIADADRRYHYFNNIETIELELLESATYNGESYASGETYPGSFAYLDNLRSTTQLSESEYSLVTTTEDNVAASKEEYYKDMIVEPEDDSTILEQAYYEAYIALMDGVVENPDDLDTIRPLIKKFYYLYNIKKEVVVYPEEELEVIDELMPLITEKYIGVLSEGVTPNYATALAQNESTTALENIVYEQLDEVEAVRDEIQFMISARLLRIDSTDTQEEYILERIEVTTGFYDNVVEDVFLDYANTSIALHIEWLKAMLSTTDQESAISDDEEEENEKIELVWEDYEDAVTNSDINEENRLAGMINYYGGTDVIDSIINQETQTSEGKTKLTELLEELAGTASEDIESGNANSGALFALIVLGDAQELNEIEDSYAGNSTYIEGIDRAGRQIDTEARTENFSQQVAEAKASSSDSADKTGTKTDGTESSEDGTTSTGSNDSDKTYSTDKSSGNTDGQSASLDTLTDSDKDTTITEDQIEDVIEDTLGSPLGELSVDGKIIAAVATGELGDSGYEPAKTISKQIMAECVAEKNKYAYKTVIQSGLEFVSLRTIDKISDFRYAYDDEQNIITMENVGSGNAFVYELGSDRVQIYNGKSEMLDAEPIKNNGYIYVIETDTIKRYGVYAEPVTETGYSGALTTEMEATKENLVNNLVAAVKELNEGN